MNIDYLRTFLTLAENGSFSETAKEHIVVQSTVSSRIQELEKELGQSLFIRNYNHAELTLAGQVFLEYAKNIVELENRAIDRIGLVGQFSERLTIGTVYAFHKCYLVQGTRRFLGNHSDISVRVEFGHSRHIISAMHQGKIDIGYSHHPFRHTGFQCSLVCEDEIIFVTGKRPAAFNKCITLRDLETLHIYNSNFLYTDAYNRIFSRYKTFQLDIDIGENIIPYLLNDDGYAFVPRKMVEKELSNELLFEIEIVDEKIPPMNNYVIYKSTSPKRKLIQQWLNEVAAD